MLSWIAVTLLICALYLTGRKNIWHWPINILGSFFLIVHFVTVADWPFVVLNIVFIVVSIQGWIKWREIS
jgi:nicotinamide mononucleotide transporter